MTNFLYNNKTNIECEPMLSSFLSLVNEGLFVRLHLKTLEFPSIVSCGSSYSFDLPGYEIQACIGWIELFSVPAR